MDRRHFMIKGISCISLGAALVSSVGICSGISKNVRKQSVKGQIPEFNDARSKKVIFVAHCILNQNARINKCAYSPCAIVPVIQELLKRGIGIIQMPCPETQILGLGRGGGRGIYDLLSESDARLQLKEYANQVLSQVEHYKNFNFKVLGVLGIDGSPCCGVDLYYNKGEKKGTGAFMEELKPLMAKCNPPVSVIGIQDAKVNHALNIISDLDKI
jgi:predicted secreted protein